MAGSSITSSFQFKSYKVDKISFFTKPDLDVLAQMNTIPSEQMFFVIVVRQPMYFKADKFYVGGVDIAIKVLRETVTIETETEEDLLVKLELGIAGIFRVEDDRLSPELEEVLVKTAIPG